MSKQSEAKNFQGYTEILRNCGNCAHFLSDMKLPRWMIDYNIKHPGNYNENHAMETNRRCRIGGFAVKKTAICILHESKK